MSSADVKRAAGAMGGMSDAQLRQQMGSMDAEKIGQASSQLNAQKSHLYNASLQLKGEGNKFFGAGKYTEAAEKYSRGKSNLEGSTEANAKALQLSCVQNLSACYLKLGKLDECIAECSLVLKQLDARSVKSFYRRGQAYKEKGLYTEAVADLKRAVELSPADDTAKAALEEVRAKLVSSVGGGPIISEPEDDEGGAEEPVVEEPVKEASAPAGTARAPVREEGLVEEDDDNDAEGAAEEIPAPEARAPPTDPAGASTSGGLPHLDAQKIEDMNRMMAENPDMLKMQADMLKGMSDEQLKSMAQAGGAPAGFDPAMAKMAAEAMSSMGPEELKSMMDMAQQMQGAGGMEGLAGGDPAAALNNPEMMRKMQDPAMMGKAMDMLKNMDPDTLVGMSEKMGMKLSKEQAEQMRSMKPEHMQFLVKLMTFLQYVYSLYAEARDFVRQRKSVQAALVILILAFVLRWLGFRV